MDLMRSGSAINLFQASQMAWTMASSSSKTVLERKRCRRYCQTFSAGLSSGERGGRGSRVRLSGGLSFWVVCPSGLVEDDHAMGSRGGLQGDLVELELHGGGVGLFAGPGRAHPARGTDGPEQIGAAGPQVGDLARPRPGLAPDPRAVGLLTDPHLVLEPDLDRRAGRQARLNARQRPCEVFLKSTWAWMSCR